MFETSAEVYYKKMENVIDYVDGAELFLKENLETELLHGSGYAYGLELYAKKQEGRLTGWVSYTLADRCEKYLELTMAKPIRRVTTARTMFRW